MELRTGKQLDYNKILEIFDKLNQRILKLNYKQEQNFKEKTNFNDQLKNSFIIKNK